jgi:hypothetical protein
MNLEVVREQIEEYELDPEDLGYTIEELKVEPAGGEDADSNDGEGFGAGGGSVGESYQVVVTCANEDEQRQVFEQLNQMGLKVKLLTL